ncbi:hypothetical protein RSOL_097670 [Rhizoctonia solani AG-3 Rhs1AP]|uniref:Uncharacterized protein n=1 Tax=Rhizoctonia solani AG-3 Rhs1AP TaxID=1086054 RepID=X8IZI7_9AGAM|nr:hypothetical protein RSOL_097670 [Rhizoctonia solani AG-3 Rhs1AP]
MPMQATKHAEVASKPLNITKSPYAPLYPMEHSHTHSGSLQSQQTSVRRPTVKETVPKGVSEPPTSKTNALRLEMTRESSQVNPSSYWVRTQSF